MKLFRIGYDEHSDSYYIEYTSNGKDWQLEASAIFFFRRDDNHCDPEYIHFSFLLAMERLAIRGYKFVGRYP